MTQQIIPKHILLLSSAENDENTATNHAFVTSLNGMLGADAIKVEWQNYHNIGLELDEHGLTSFIVSTMQPLTSFDAVYFKSYFRYHEQATAIAESLRAHNVTFVGKELQEYIPAYKLSQMARLSRAGLPIPFTIYLPLEHYATNYEYLTKKLGDKFIFKAINGSTGDDNYLVNSIEQLQEIVAANPELQFIAQAFIPNDSDLRVLIVGSDLKLIIKRSRHDDSTHLNNTSQGAHAELMDIAEFDEYSRSLSLKAAALMNREVAGVDLMFETGTGKPYILEVNASPQIASGSFAAEKLAVYAQYFKDLVA